MIPQIELQTELLTATAPIFFTKQPIAWLRVLWKFSRPHTIIGTSLSVLGLFLITTSRGLPVTEPGVWDGTSFNLPPSSFIFSPVSLLLTWLACLCGNIYIVGLNQLEDVEIDRINKPSLPLASGEFSRQQGLAIVSTTGILAIVLAALQSPYLLAMVGLSLLIGTAYSLPPVRLKQFPFWASLCILTVRGAVVNVGLYLHFSSAIPAAQFPIPPVVWALTLFVLIFTIAIAIFKDIPDMEGDRQYNISTFTLRLGQHTVFNLTRWILTLCYAGMAIAGLAGLTGVNRPFLITTHGLLLLVFWVRSLTVELQDRTAIAPFYQFIWKLFFLEYLIVPAACLIAHTP